MSISAPPPNMGSGTNPGQNWDTAQKWLKIAFKDAEGSQDHPPIFCFLKKKNYFFLKVLMVWQKKQQKGTNPRPFSYVFPYKADFPLRMKNIWKSLFFVWGLVPRQICTKFTNAMSKFRVENVIFRHFRISCVVSDTFQSDLKMGHGWKFESKKSSCF